MSSRPPTKRVREDRDHSKASTKRSETHRQAKTAEEKEEAKSKAEEHEDVDWVKEAPYCYEIEKPKGWEQKWRQSCWCGKTAFVYQGDPLQSKICHCEDCQRLHGAPFQHSAIFKKDSVRLDSSPEWIGFLSAHGEVHPLSHTPTPLPRKISCRACGSPLFDEGRNMIMAFPPTFEWKRGDIDEEEHENPNVTEKGESKAKKAESKPESKSKKSGDKDQSKDNDDSGDDEGKHGDTREASQNKSNGQSKVNSRGRHAGLPKELQAQCHIFYARRSIDVPDGLPKWVGHKEKSEQCGETD